MTLPYSGDAIGKLEDGAINVEKTRYSDYRADGSSYRKWIRGIALVGAGVRLYAVNQQTSESPCS